VTARINPVDILKFCFEIFASLNDYSKQKCQIRPSKIEQFHVDERTIKIGWCELEWVFPSLADDRCRKINIKYQ